MAHMTPEEFFSEYDKELRPGCLCVESSTGAPCGKPARWFVRIAHSYGTCLPAKAWICEGCYSELINQNYPARCPTCRRHMFRSVEDMITTLEEL